MTAVAPEADSPFAVAVPSAWNRVDERAEHYGERLNPILVKESRQALKSRQFTVTFALLLICGWAWSLIGVACIGPAVYYTPSGAFLLIGYHFILTVPMILIVPFSAYRSLAGERDDGTYELLSITTLSSRQIVTGKLGSAVLQMLIYYSALAPCIAFTYLLRGIDVFTIGLVLVYSFAVSLLLSAFGLMIAAVTRLRHVQMLLSVALLIGLVIATVTWWVTWGEAIDYSNRLGIDQPDFWIAHGAVLSALLSYVLLFIFAAAAQLSFASDDRSTKLRILMLLQQTLFTGWMMYYWVREHERGILFVWLSFSALHWAVMGSLMTGELATLSPRVKRQLPQSLLGRIFLTWFNPGSGTGYMFAVVNLGAVAALAVVFGSCAQLMSFSGAPKSGDLYLFGAMAWAYVTAYLGVGRLLVLVLRRYLYFGLLLPFLLHVVLAILGCAVPLFIQAWLTGVTHFREYSALQITNWFWTLGVVADGATPILPPVLAVVAVFALSVLTINLILASREIEQVRQEAPERVREDERQLHPELALAERKPRSPWDE